MTIQINSKNNQLFSNSQEAFTLENKSRIGEKKDGRIYYSPYEAQYLIDIKKAKSISFRKPKDFHINYIVFKHLRKNHIVKTGLKFGSDFRVYLKKDKHALYLVHIIKQSEKLNLKDLISKTRIAHSTAKILLLAIVDSEDNITFQEVNWVKI